ncbi:N-acetyl-gamma-glutamyl-phosphate reductase [Luteococcus sp. H138]|uniref:N-acetyl-gamma-glutamyl-phosphate reductase n=1 Tax=unclassified Luteococcus TaxID=2639923 RepID=UPI00313CE33A
MTFTVAVAGCTGYAGGEVLRLLLGHPEITIGKLTAGSSAGSRLGQHQPHLLPLADREVLPTTAENLTGHDVVFLALPHGTSGPVAEQIAALPGGDRVLIIDCGADFRLESAEQWVKYYKSEHAGTWPYGLPEMPGQRELLKATQRIAVPGCYPTATTLALLPALTRGLVTGQDVVVAAASGSSGAGKAPKPNLLGAELFGSASAYGVGGVHRHVPELLQNFAKLGGSNPSVSFTPLLVPMARGILAVVTAPVKPGVTAADIREAYVDAYAGEPFVHVLPDGQWPQSQHIVGSNAVHVNATLDADAGRLVAVGTLDNLCKGTAGGAIQSMNIALGLDEATGLSTIGVAP